MSCGGGHRRGSDPELLWLWRRLAATAPIRPLAWEPPYAATVAQEMAKRQKNKKQTFSVEPIRTCLVSLGLSKNKKPPFSQGC